MLSAARKSLPGPSLLLEETNEDANGRFVLHDITKWLIVTILEWIVGFQKIWSFFC
jgi:hypothetical protein